MIATPLMVVKGAADAYQQPPTWRARGAEVLRIKFPGAAVYLWRGTDFDGWRILRDTVADLRFMPTRDPDIGLCHRGFNRGVRAVWPLLLPQLARDVKAGLEITTGGHSKGGGEAEQFAAVAIKNGFPIAALATYGAPRSGFAELGGILATIPRRRRYVNGLDCVPTVPPPLGFIHGIAATSMGTRDGIFIDHKISDYQHHLARLTRSGDTRAAWA